MITISGYNIEVCFDKYTVNDDMYKVVAIALWVADNINYVSDPRGLDYVQPPDEVLEARGVRLDRNVCHI